MSHNIRSRTHMHVAARERGHRAQIAQVALALLALLSILLWNQLVQTGAGTAQQQPKTSAQVMHFTELADSGFVAFEIAAA